MNKICHLTSVHPIDDIRIFYKECTSLAANGFDVTLIACGDSAFEEVKNGVKRISLNIPVKNRLQRIIKRSKAVYNKALEVNADIYHFHDPELLFIGYLLRRKGKIVIFDAHEDFPKQILQKTYIPKIFRLIVSKMASVIDRLFPRKLSLIISVVPSIHNKYLRYGCKSIEVRNYPILHERTIPKWEERKKTICYAGGITELRGIGTLLDTIVNTKYTINLAGAFSDEHYESKVKNHPGWKQVKYHGFVSQNELSKIYNTSKIGIGLFHPAPNHTDGITTKLYEYMYAGLPVIISESVKSNKEVVEKHKCGIVVNTFNKKEIVNAIELLMNNDRLAQEMGENGSYAVKALYCWENEEKKLIEMYNKLKTLK